MFNVLIGLKVILYFVVFTRAFQQAPVSFLLVLIALALLISGFVRSFFKYHKTNVNIITLLLDLVLAFLFSLYSQNGSFDKLFIIYVTEGTAILPTPIYIIYAALTTAISTGATVLYGFRESGQLQWPEIAEILFYGFLFILVFSERRQREQKLAYEKLSKELQYVNFQLKESMALSEELASEAERRRIAGEIHDSLGHSLTGLILTLEAGKKLTRHDVEAGSTYWDKALQISRTALHSIRELVSEKKESYFEFDLLSRLKEMVQETQEITGLKIDLAINSKLIWLSGKEQFQIYRIFQEAITNTLRHTNANYAKVSISDKQDMLTFSYWDNGSGTNQINLGNGLKGMNNRIASIGGSLTFDSGSGKGFKIEGCIDRRGKVL